MQPGFARAGALAAITGAITLFVATMLHPMTADPNDPSAAFAEYAQDSLWVASHLVQFLGICLLGAALLALAAVLEEGPASAWARIGTLGTTASVAATGALQAVDGVALKVMVDRWAHAAGDARVLAFESAFAVRQIEIGLASLLSVLFGLTIVCFGVGLIVSRQFSKLLGWLGVLGGVGTIAAGIALAYTGFSSFAMTISMSASSVLLLWAIAIGIGLWRRASDEH